MPGVTLTVGTDSGRPEEFLSALTSSAYR